MDGVKVSMVSVALKSVWGTCRGSSWISWSIPLNIGSSCSPCVQASKQCCFYRPVASRSCQVAAEQLSPPSLKRTETHGLGASCQDRLRLWGCGGNSGWSRSCCCFLPPFFVTCSMRLTRSFTDLWLELLPTGSGCSTHRYVPSNLILNLKAHKQP